VGLMLTVGVFRLKERVAEVFEGWGILGTILLVVMVATVPYGLCRGFGLSNPRAFFLTYILKKQPSAAGTGKDRGHTQSDCQG
jgi:hypothetical protein